VLIVGVSFNSPHPHMDVWMDVPSLSLLIYTSHGHSGEGLPVDKTPQEVTWYKTGRIRTDPGGSKNTTAS